LVETKGTLMSNSVRWWMIGLSIFVVASSGLAETALPAGLEIELLPGYEHKKLQGIDSIVGEFVKKDGLKIQYEIGGVSPPGGIRVGGSYSNYAESIPAADLLWRKTQKVNGHAMTIAYTKQQRVTVSVPFKTVGVNISTVAKTPEELADVLLMVMTLSEKRAK